MPVLLFSYSSGARTVFGSTNQTVNLPFALFYSANPAFNGPNTTVSLSSTFSLAPVQQIQIYSANNTVKLPFTLRGS